MSINYQANAVPKDIDSCMLEQPVHWELQLLKAAFWECWGNWNLFKIAIKYRVTHQVLIGVFVGGRED